MVDLLIIADDFTGALDTAVQFVKRGAETLVYTGKDLDRSRLPASVRVLVVDPETRLMSAREAYETVYILTRQAVRLGVGVIYKKTDSALRGNVGSELEAVLDGAGGGRLHFIPAFPEAGRITEKGVQYIDGVRLDETSFGRDPFDPVADSYIPGLLSEQTHVPVRVIGVGEEITAPEREKEILVYDAGENIHIRGRAAELKKRGELRLLAGCAGFASFLPEELGLCGASGAEIQRTGCFFVACGSLNPITREQVVYAEQNGFYRKTLTPEQKLCPGYYDTPAGRMFLEKLAQECLRERWVEVDSFGSLEQGDTDAYARALGINPDGARFAVSTCLGKIVRRLLEQEIDMTVLMTGGDTLMGFMREIGVTHITPVAELEQGAVLSSLSLEGRRLQVISKSGGFGGKEVLVEIARRVVREQEQQLVC